MTESVPELTRRPARTSSAVAWLALAAGVFASGPFSSLALRAGAVALVVLGAGLWTGSRRLVTIGCAAALLGVIGAGVRGLPAVPTLTSATAIVVAWDAGHQAIGLGEQLGREAATVRAELPHVGATGAVGLTVSIASYGVFLAAPGGLPVAAVVLGLLGALALLAALHGRAE